MSRWDWLETIFEITLILLFYNCRILIWNVKRDSTIGVFYFLKRKINFYIKKQPYNLESRIDEEITEISKLEIKIWKWPKFKDFKNKIGNLQNYYILGKNKTTEKILNIFLSEKLKK